jgi:hypothetical protein
MSRRVAIWSAAALSLIFVLLLSTVLLNPVLGSEGDNDNDGVVTTNSLYDPQNYAGEWDDDDEHGDDHDDDHDNDDHEEHEDDDD